MKLEQVEIISFAQTLAGVLLVGAIALVGYDSAKPGVVLASPSMATIKESPMNPPSELAGAVNRLPVLPERYQRKVLVYGWRSRWGSGKNFTNSAETGKLYQVSSVKTQADEE
ncbi:MAG: hypothetical protein FJW36_10680 [Acidobacteria bacterium]|nr:hypothetical protein [Acidobacteriota bacterium]